MHMCIYLVLLIYFNTCIELVTVFQDPLSYRFLTGRSFQEHAKNNKKKLYLYKKEQFIYFDSNGKDLLSSMKEM